MEVCLFVELDACNHVVNSPGQCGALTWKNEGRFKSWSPEYCIMWRSDGVMWPEVEQINMKSLQ